MSLLNEYLSVKNTAQADLQLVADGSCRPTAVMHDLNDLLALKNLLQAMQESCLDGGVACHHVKDKARRSCIHLQHRDDTTSVVANQAP